jgi:hypothetical protein
MPIKWDHFLLGLNHGRALARLNKAKHIYLYKWKNQPSDACLPS